VILADPAQYEKFIAINALALVDTSIREGLTPEQAMTAIGAQVPADVQAAILTRVYEVLTGTDDVLLRNNTTGDTGFYAISNGVNTGWYDLGGSSTAYSVVATGDYLGNGNTDILFRNNTTGDTGFYAISGGVKTGWYDLGASSTAYHVVN